MANEGSNLVESVDGIEVLRMILERQQARDVTYEEATEIGQSLITFFEVLGEGSDSEAEKHGGDGAGA